MQQGACILIGTISAPRWADHRASETEKTVAGLPALNMPRDHVSQQAQCGVDDQLIYKVAGPDAE